MPFPTLLRPRDAEISAIIFENTTAGVPLDLYWSFRVEFESIRYAERVFECSLSADWVRINQRDWRGLGGYAVAGGHDVVDASFYTGAHDSVTYTCLRIGERQGARFQHDWQARVDFQGWTDDDAEADLFVQARTAAEFTGVLVYAPLLRSCGSPREGAERLLSRFVDRGAFGVLVNQLNEFGVDEWRLLPA